MSGTAPLTAEEARQAFQLGREAGQRACAFARDLVRIPSPSGDEEAAARRTADEMRACGFDEVEIDGAGNVLGLLRADAHERSDGAVLLDAHLDHVDAGDVSCWTHPPFAGIVEHGRLFGRGATDTKSAVAAQVHAGALLRRLSEELGLRRRHDVLVAAVVQEEVGGLGTARLLESGRQFHAAVIGEPSAGSLAFGHRGRVEVEVTFEGRAAHAARPERGLNPHPSLARFISALDELAHDEDAQLGQSTSAPTLVRVTPASPNVVPQEVTLTLDWRHVPSESPDEVVRRVQAAADAAAFPGVVARVRCPTRLLRSWTGDALEVKRVSRAFATDPASGVFTSALGALSHGTGQDTPAIPWDFASDGGWLHARGVPCVGYGPGDPDQMHVATESVSLARIAEAVPGTALLALALDRTDAGTAS